MTSYLADTSAVSLFAPGRSPPPERFVTWSVATGRDWWVPTIVVAELEFGIHKLRRAGGTRRAGQLESWLQGLIDQFRERIIDLDLGVAHELARLNDSLVASGRHPGMADLVIAATALSRGCVVVTGNLRHFRAAGLQTIDPFQSEFPAN